MRGARSRVDVALPPIHADAKINRAIVSRSTYVRSVYVVKEPRYPGMRSRFLGRSIDRSIDPSLGADPFIQRATIDRPAIHARVTAFKLYTYHTLYPTFVHT